MVEFGPKHCWEPPKFCALRKGTRNNGVERKGYKHWEDDRG